MNLSTTTKNSIDVAPRRGQDRVRLLISVRDVEEATIALRGGADLIDVKEPNRGALGAADSDVLEAIVLSVNGEVPLSVARGELLEHSAARSRELFEKKAHCHARDEGQWLRGMNFAKFGLAGCAAVDLWPELLRQACQSLPPSVAPVAVIYADWLSADAPPPSQVLDTAEKIGCRAILVDTLDKKAGNLFNHFDAESLSSLVQDIRKRGMLLVLAGSLTQTTLPKAFALEPDYLALRGAACDGDRCGTISLQKVQDLKGAIERLQSLLAD